MLKLIIIDDEDVTIQGILQSIDWLVYEIKPMGYAKNGLEGIRLAEQVKPDIALLDVRMPKCNGIACAQQIIRVLPQCKILFMSGYSDKEYLKAAIKLNAIDYIEKPIDLNEMKQVLRKTVQICRAEDELRERQSLVLKQLEHSLVTVRQDVAARLCFHHCDIEEIQRICTEFSLRFPSTSGYISAIFHVSPAVHEHDEIADKLLYLTQTVFAKNGLCTKLPGSGVAVHLRRFPGEGRSFFETALIQIRRRVADAFSQADKVLIAVGEEAKGFGEIWRSYSEAERCLPQVFIRGYEPVLSMRFYQNIEIPEIQDAESQIQRFLEEENVEAVSALLPRLEKRIKRPCVSEESLHSIQQSYDHIIISLCAFMRRTGEIREASEHLRAELTALLREGTVEELTSKLCKMLDTFSPPDIAVSVKNPKVATALRYIYQNYHRNISITDIAEHSGLSPNYLSSLFKSETKLTITLYLENIRINKAKYLLLNTSLKLNEISMRTGYSNAAYFISVFRKHTGQSPSEYRRK